MKKNELRLFAATWTELEIIIFNEAKERQISYDISYMSNLKKKGTNELTSLRETHLFRTFRASPLIQSKNQSPYSVL